MKRKMIYLMLPLLMLSVASVKAQVLIGGAATDNPSEGAILDLRNTDAAKGGLLLPRVALTNLESLDDISGENKDATALAGLTVYNTTSCTEGVYTWDGSKWKLVGPTTQDCSSVQDVEGNSYYAARFGCAGCWMTENLRTTQYTNGTSLTENSNPNDASLKYYYYPEGKKATFDSNKNYGLLYTWAAATNRTGISGDEGNSSDQEQCQGICPTGWHLPSDYEWNELEKEISESVANKYSTTGATTWETSYSTTSGNYRGDHGQKMKSTTDVNTGDSYEPNGTSLASNQNGFNALLVGDVYHGSSPNFGTSTSFWSSSSYSGAGAWRRALYYGNAVVTRSNNNKYTLYSVRCKKNVN